MIYALYLMCKSDEDINIYTFHGIGTLQIKDLATRGITRSHHLLGQFLKFDKDEEIFCAWLTGNFYTVKAHHSKKCYEHLKKQCLNL